MYCLEGELLVRQKPETLLGLYGCMHVAELHAIDTEGTPATHTDTITRTGDEDYVLTARERLIVSGDMPIDTPIELISTVEQAEKYIRTSKKDLRVAQRRINLEDALSNCVPESFDLLEGSAFLWKDRRYPTPFVYLLAHGALITEVEYDQQQGWHHTHDEFEGSRTVSGLVTPVTYRTTERYKYVGTTKRWGEFRETKGHGTNRRRGYHVSVNLHVGKQPETEKPSMSPKVEEDTIIQDYQGQLFVVTGTPPIADRWEKKQKLSAGVNYRRLDENGAPIGDTYTRRKRDVLRKTIKQDGKRIPLFTVRPENTQQQGSNLVP